MMCSTFVFVLLIQYTISTVLIVYTCPETIFKIRNSYGRIFYNCTLFLSEALDLDLK